MIDKDNFCLFMLIKVCWCNICRPGIFLWDWNDPLDPAISMALERKRSSRRNPSRRKRPPENKCKTCCRRFTAFMFSHVGLCGLVVGYSILGAFAFQALEAPFEEKKVDEVMRKRMDTVKRLWAITDQLNVLYKENWTRQVTEEVKRFQTDLVNAIKEGYDGKEGSSTQWTFSGAFLYSLTVITTIGKCLFVHAKLFKSLPLYCVEITIDFWDKFTINT